ncbi:MAG: phosphatase PAP2 family protein [Paludibacteraceae bacterium]|nr:phosphatase PAP2 family protein [Paludibacteraceae bacterium]
MGDVWNRLVDWLDGVDKALFLALNSHYSDLSDNFMLLVTDKWVWIPFYLLLIYLIVKSARKESFWYIMLILLTIVLADQFASGLCKPLFERFRPVHAPELEGMVHSVIGKNADLYGFISSHAANCFGLAMFTALYFRRWQFSLLVFGWAALNAYSRISLGMHYPGDLLAGALAGMLFAWLCYLLAEWCITHTTFCSYPSSRQGRKRRFNRLSNTDLYVCWGMMAVVVWMCFQSGRILL